MMGFRFTFRFGHRHGDRDGADFMGADAAAGDGVAAVKALLLAGGRVVSGGIVVERFAVKAVCRSVGRRDEVRSEEEK